MSHTRVKAQIDTEALDEMELAIEVTMTVSQWRQMMRQCGPEHPACEVGRRVSAVLGHVTKTSRAIFNDPPKVS
jgi:hypothetical protein